MYVLTVKVRTDIPTKTWGIWNNTLSKWHTSKSYPTYGRAIQGLGLEKLKFRR